MKKKTKIVFLCMLSFHYLFSQCFPGYSKFKSQSKSVRIFVAGTEMTELAEKLNYDREVVRVWFCNKRQAFKNTVKKLKVGDTNGGSGTGVSSAGTGSDSSNTT